MTDAQDCPEVTGYKYESLVGVSTGEPAVNVVLVFADGSTKAINQMSPGKAITQGIEMIAAAEAATSDATVFKVLTEQTKLGIEDAARFLMATRKMREESK